MTQEQQIIQSSCAVASFQKEQGACAHMHIHIIL